MASQKQILIGAGLVGASIFILPSLIGGNESQTQGGGGGVPSIAMVGLPSSLGGVADSSTKKESGTTTIYNFPKTPNLNITESNDLGISETKKETSISPYTSITSSSPVGTTEPVYKNDIISGYEVVTKEGGISTKTPDVYTKKETIEAPTTSFFSTLLNFVKPTSWLPFF